MSASVETSKAAPTSVPEPALPTGGQGITGSGTQGLDSWIENFRKYEAILQEVTKASAETKFKAELDTIEQWFKVLNEPERTASVYTLLQDSNQDQIRFYMTVLQQKMKPEAAKADAKPEDASITPVDSAKLKQSTRRPPSLNLPELGSPTTPTATPVTAKDSAVFPTADAAKNRLAGLRLNTQQIEPISEHGEGIAGLPGLGMMSPYHLNMIANAGLSKDAQLLAVQLIMSGIVQPVGGPAASTQPQRAAGKKPSHLGDAKAWRTPTSAKYPGSALRTGGLRATALKSAGIKSGNLPSASLPSASLPSAGLNSSGLDSPSVATPREEDFKPEMLDDIPGWLRTLRLHKYNSCFDGLSWQELVVLDDATLEAKGVAALGARRRLLRTFEFVRKRMGMEPSEDSPSSATPTTSALPKPSVTSEDQLTSAGPKSAAPNSKLSVTSPAFVPSFDRAPHSAAPTVPVAETVVDVAKA